MPALAASAVMTRSLVLAGAFGGLIVAATIALWVYYGTAVFFEVVRAGWMACF